MSAFNVRVGLHVEEVEGTVLVLDAASLTVLELTGEQAEAFRLAQAGPDLVPDHLTAAMAGLVELGLVTAPGWNRRQVLLAGGAAAAAAAVVAIALPSAAAAQSAPGGGGEPVLPVAPGAPTITSISQQPRNANVFRVFFTLGDANGFEVLDDLNVEVNGNSNTDGSYYGNPIFVFGVGRGDTIRVRQPFNGPEGWTFTDWSAPFTIP